FLNELVGHPEIREAVAISTCNRTELYLVVGDPVEAESVALAALARQAEMRPTELLGRLYALRDVEAVRHLFGVAGGLDSLIVGAGENGELTAQALHRKGAHTVFVANRRYDRAIGLAQRFGGTAVRFDDLPAQLAEVDIVVSCTSSPHQIVGRDELALVVEQREGRPLLMIDIAVPRDLDPTVRDLPSITLYDMDDLQREVAQNLSGREAEATRARTLVDEETERFAGWLAGLDVVPTIAALHERADEIVTQLLRAHEPG